MFYTVLRFYLYKHIVPQPIDIMNISMLSWCIPQKGRTTELLSIGSNPQYRGEYHAGSSEPTAVICR